MPQPDLAAELDRDAGVAAGGGGMDVATGYRQAVTRTPAGTAACSG